MSPRDGATAPPSATGDEPFLRLLEDLEDLGFFLLDPQGRVTRWTRGAERVLGFTASEAVGLPLARLYPPDDRQTLPAREMAAAVETGPITVEAWRMRGDGVRIWTTFTLAPLREGRHTLFGFGAVVRDLTDRHEAARRYEESRQRYRSLFDFNPDPVFALDLSGRIEGTNGAAEALIGRAAPELAGRPLTELFAREDVARVREALADPDGGPGGTVEATLAIPDTDPIELRLTFAPILLDETRIGLYCLGEDVTARVRSARERERLLARERLARREAEVAARAKSDFLAVVSHELRTPLTAISGYADLLADEITGPLNEAQHRQVERIRSRSAHMVDQIGQILSLVRLAEGEEGVELGPVRIPSLVREIEASVEVPDGAGPVRFRTEVDPNVGEAPYALDAAKVRRILQNVLHNAWKFTTEGEIVLSVAREGKRLRFSITDTGSGIPAEHLERIFEPFWQVEGPVTRTADGVGIGLSIARGLAERMDGELSVESTPGRGTVVRLDLPVVREAEPS